MRITHVIRSDAFAGAERYVCTAAIRQDAQGHVVTVIGGAGERVRSALSGSTARWVPASTVVGAVRQLRAQGPADIVHAHMTAAELAAVIGARSAEVVCTRHFAAARGASVPGRVVAGFISARIRTQIAISGYVARSVEGTSIVVHPGTPDVPQWVPAQRRKPVVLVAQRLEAEKRTDLALRAWAGSGLAGLGWQLRVAGDGVARGALEKLARELGVERSCSFLGARGDIDEMLLSASLLLAPRHDEPYGLSVVEAMAAGVPIVAGGGGGHDETVGSSPHAALIPAGRADVGGQLLRDLALDPDRRDRYGADLQRLQRKAFSADKQVDAVTAVYHTLVAQ